MNKILSIVCVTLCFCAAFVILSWSFEVDPVSNPIDPRSPPSGIKPGVYSHETTKKETWSNIPVNSKENGNTEAASFEKRSSTAGNTENTEEEELFDYGKQTAVWPNSASGSLFSQSPAQPPVCDGSCPEIAPVPIYPPSERSGPPAPAYIGERAPYWYEKEGQYREPDWPGPGDEAEERKGLFARLREKRAGR